MDNTQRLGIELRRLFLDTTTDNNADVLAVYDRGYAAGREDRNLPGGKPVELSEVKVGDQVLIAGKAGEQFIFTVDGVTTVADRGNSRCGCGDLHPQRKTRGALAFGHP